MLNQPNQNFIVLVQSQHGATMAQQPLLQILFTKNKTIQAFAPEDDVWF